jgi:hypothetical protein
MNNVYFACEDCRVMVDAGYRWAAHTLEESGIVGRRQTVSAERVLAAVTYWDAPSDLESKWLDEVLPTVRAFLETHGQHRLTYGDAEEIVGLEPTAMFDWLDAGYLPEMTPRYFVETLGFRSWSEVLTWARATEDRPWWWDEPELKDSARTRFQEMVARAAQPAAAADGASARR